MKIKRTVDTNTTIWGTSGGVEVEFELTADELRDAFYEQQEIYDRTDMMYYLEEIGQEYLHDIGYKTEFINKLPQYLDDMGAELRRQMDKYDLAWSDARGTAFDIVLQRITSWMEEDEYKEV